ncbi:MAG: MurR/RpiR family transcriptional regulator [Solobacterium sp.]|nr:MurR/RpiR family transcriptional regulator [Solobacterium sp.]
MANFFAKTSEKARNLSQMEGNLLNYTIKNLHLVKDMSIRQFAKENYVSTSTVLRFTNKMGYEGWNDFIKEITEANQENRRITIPSIVQSDDYRDSYLKNVIEAVKVITDEKIEKFDHIMSRHPMIYILGEGFSEQVGHYLYRLLKVCDFDAEFPRTEYEFNSVLRRIKRDDTVIILSYSGENQRVISRMHEILAVATPTIISVTRADNNTIQNMSDLNFYVFADEIQYENMDVTSRCGMIAILELLMYKHITRASVSKETI